jgi:hypothetical protein
MSVLVKTAGADFVASQRLFSVMYSLALESVRGRMFLSSPYAASD